MIGNKEEGPWYVGRHRQQRSKPVTQTSISQRMLPPYFVGPGSGPAHTAARAPVTSRSGRAIASKWSLEVRRRTAHRYPRRMPPEMHTHWYLILPPIRPKHHDTHSHCPISRKLLFPDTTIGTARIEIKTLLQCATGSHDNDEPTGRNSYVAEPAPYTQGHTRL